uniref:non-specific serine/threonine protein kinase n=2 Tax=Anthurium amnicola TaxID=1678845 RepID=A0A1D1ZJI7_9ARAE
MELPLKAVLVNISFLLCIRCSLCDELLNGSNALKWTCVCAASHVGSNCHLPPSNCSTSCHCTPEVGIVGADEHGWTCLCAPDQVSREPSTDNNSCFTSCNCTSGFSNASTSTKRHISNKVIVIILLLCVVITAIAFITAASCYFYRKDRCHMQSQIFSDRDTSWNSATNLISHRTASFTRFQESGFKPITGFICRDFFMFRRKRQTLLSCIIQFSYFELEHATNKFSTDNLIGLGGSSNVYRGQLKDGRFVAVKKLKMVGGTDTESEFLTEIELISRLNHCHVVPLLGYCIECQGKQFKGLLVFEYMSNGDLRNCLNASKGKDPLDWGTRVKIALGVARGLEYLHEAAAPRILHRDIKSTNILLDDKYIAKITDLGMAKCLMTDDLISCTTSPARMLGTFGYFAPEYAIVGKASLKSDVFSFGVVILELITGRQPIHKSTNKGDESLVIWAANKLLSSKLVVSELPDPLLEGKFSEEEMQIMAHLVRECLHWDPDSRPSMSEVVQILSTITSDKMKRKNLSSNLFLSSLSCSIKSTSKGERHEDLQEVSIEKIELNQVISEKPHATYSLAFPVGQNVCDRCQANDGTTLSTRHRDGLMHSMSNARRSNALDDEIVDLTEPRFETFMQENIHI